MASKRRICKQLHLPFQSGSDRLLQLMRRNHTLAEYVEKVQYLQRIAPGVELSSDLIVGFPGETEEDFEQTLHCLREVGFMQLFPFKYSPRPGTVAAELEDDVPREVKEERLARVIALQTEISDAKTALLRGSIQDVLIDAAHPRERGAMNGRTDGFRPITVRGGGAIEIGDMVRARVTEHRAHWLAGELVESPVLAV